MEYRKYQSARVWLHLITLPFIWLPLPALILFDILAGVYQFICFPIYRIPKVRRVEYVLIFDRNKLKYLNIFEKLGCMYCGYTNGVLLYLKEIAGRTEKYWCGIMHADKPGFRSQADQVERNFARFNDKKDFDNKYPLDVK